MNLEDHFYGLSVVATRMLQTTLQLGPDAAVERLAEEYGAPPERIRNDLAAFLTDLELKRIIRQTKDRGISDRVGRSLSWAAVTPMLWWIRLIRGQRAKISLLLALALLNCRLLGWAPTVAAWRRACPQPLALPPDPDAVMRAIDTTTRSVAASHLLPVACKERALTTWALGRTAGVPVELVVGVQAFPLQGHCWCTYENAVYSDDAERCAQFRQVWRCS
jgi:hypothetical protein